MIELSSPEIENVVEVVSDHVEMIALPERGLKLAIAGRVQGHDTVVFLTRDGVDIMVSERKGEARR